jgi:hypothetical protein
MHTLVFSKTVIVFRLSFSHCIPKELKMKEKKNAYANLPEQLSASHTYTLAL